MIEGRSELNAKRVHIRRQGLTVLINFQCAKTVRIECFDIYWGIYPRKTSIALNILTERTITTKSVIVFVVVVVVVVVEDSVPKAYPGVALSNASNLSRSAVRTLRGREGLPKIAESRLQLLRDGPENPPERKNTIAQARTPKTQRSDPGEELPLLFL